MVVHLHDLDAGDGAQRLARLLDDAVVAGQVAGVVVGDLALRQAVVREDEPARGEQLREELAVVLDGELAAHLLVLVADGVEAVRAGRDDRLLGDLVLVERLDVGAGQHLVDVLVAHAAGRVAGAVLLLAQDREADAGGVKAGGDGAGDALVTVVERGRAANPVEDLELVELARGLHLLRGADGEGQALRPVKARAGRLAPRVGHALHAAEDRGELCRELGLHEDQVPAHAHDLVHVLDEHRAGLDARAAGDAVPRGVVLKHGRNEGHGHGIGLEAVVQAVGGAHGRAVRDERDRHLGPVRLAADVHDQLLGVERLARVVRGAGLLAAPALGAGEAVEDVLPGQVRELAQAERGVLVLEIHHRQAAAGLQLAEPDVHEAGIHVEVLVERDEDKERGENENVTPPQDHEGGGVDALREAAQRYGQDVGDERARDVAPRSGLEGHGEELRGDDERDEREDLEARGREGEARGAADEAAIERVGRAGERHHGDDLLDRDQRRPEDPVEWPPNDGVEEAAGHHVHVADEQDGGAQEETQVHHAHAGLAVHPGLDDRVPDQAAEAPPGALVALRPLAAHREHDAHVLAQDEQERGHRAPEDRQHQRIERDLLEVLEHVQASSVVPVGRSVRPAARCAAWSKGPARVSSA